MSALTIYPGNLPQHGERYTDFTAVQNQLHNIGVQFERWTANGALAADAIDRLMQRYDFQSVDVIKLNPDHPEKAAFRQKFLAEHIHNDFEVRFFVEGCGLFYLHVEPLKFMRYCANKAI